MSFLKLCFAFAVLLLATEINSQTLGTVYFDYNLTSPGYLLYGPSGQNNAYLVDNCGRIVNEWNGSQEIANSCYLDTSGNIVKTIKDNISPLINDGGAYDRVVVEDWNGTTFWNYQYGGILYRPHHDVINLPNGNIILLVWEVKTYNNLISIGKDTSTMTDTLLYSETLIEIERTGLTTGNIVWKWDMFDHIIQDFDISKANFGVIADHPELININLLGGGNNAGTADWLHANSISYIEEFDQIVLSLRKISEAIIIDHSTTTLEASSHSGGTYGKGGDFLYRIGNPANYQIGNLSDKLLFRQHDCKVFESNGSFYMSVFNNGNDRPTQYSSVDFLKLPINLDGSYNYTTGSIFEPSNYFYTYTAPNPTDFFATRTSGAQILENGNLLVCHGPNGQFFEIDTTTNSKVWEYYNPIDANGSNNDGINPATLQNSLFKVNKYAESYQGFVGKDLTPGNYVELNSLNSCYLSISNSTLDAVKIYPNPFTDHLEIEGYKGAIEIFDFSGRLVFKSSNTTALSLSHLQKGSYLLKINNSLHSIVKF